MHLQGWDLISLILLMVSGLEISIYPWTALHTHIHTVQKSGSTNGSGLPDCRTIHNHVAPRADHVTEEIPIRKSPISVDSEEFSRRKPVCRLVQWRLFNGWFPTAVRVALKFPCREPPGYDIKLIRAWLRLLIVTIEFSGTIFMGFYDYLIHLWTLSTSGSLA